MNLNVNVVLVCVTAVGLFLADMAIGGEPKQEGVHNVGDLRVKRLLVVDGEGRVRVAVAVDKNGPHLAMYGDNGKGFAEMSVGTDNSASLIMSDEANSVRVGLYAAHQIAGLSVFDSKRNLRTHLGSNALEQVGGPEKGTIIKTPESSLVLYDDRNKVVWKAP